MIVQIGTHMWHLCGAAKLSLLGFGIARSVNLEICSLIRFSFETLLLTKFDVSLRQAIFAFTHSHFRIRPPSELNKVVSNSAIDFIKSESIPQLIVLRNRAENEATSH